MCQSAGLRFNKCHITSSLNLEKIVLPHWLDEKRPICEYVDGKVEHLLKGKQDVEQILAFYRSEFRVAFKNPLVNDSAEYIEPRVIGILTYYAPYLSLFKKFDRKNRYISAIEDGEWKQSCMMRRLEIMSNDVYSSIMKYIQSDEVFDDNRTLKQALREEYVKRFEMDHHIRISFSNRIINGFLIPALVNRMTYLILADC